MLKRAYPLRDTEGSDGDTKLPDESMLEVCGDAARHRSRHWTKDSAESNFDPFMVESSKYPLNKTA